MPAIFSKNCVLMGELDFYCLACSNHLKSEDDVLSHIQSSKHKRRCNSVGYFEKYKEDFIRKVDGVYFCEVCNTALSTAAKVTLHVTEAAHVAGRRGRAVRRAGDGIVFGGHVTVSDSAWNGLVGDACVLCNVEFDDQISHKSDRRHLVNLINNNVIVNDDKDIYRKVDNVFQCLTCNQVVSQQSLTEHLNSEDHKACTKLHKSKDDESNRDESGASSVKKHIRPPVVDKNIHSKPTETKGDDAEILTASTSLPKEIESLSKRHGLSVKGDGVVYCTVCSKQLTATVTCVEAHVTSAQHKGNINKSAKDHKSTSKDIKKVPFKEFAIRLHFIVEIDCDYFIINDSLCVRVFPFLGISRFENKLICRFCNIDMNLINMQSHVRSTQHLDFIENCLVITSLGNELVREIKSDLYDCGYCGITKTDLDDMIDHLATSEHERCKDEHQMKLISLRLQLPQERYGNPFEMIMMKNFFRF